MAANETITIAILPESAVVTSNINGDITGTVTSTSDLVFFTLFPRQKNTISFSGANGNESVSSIVMTYYNRYLSVYDPCYTIDCDEVVDTSTFISEWNTENTSTGSSTSTQISLPLESSGTYNFVVDWGDGGNQDHITVWNQAQTTHTYATAGVYTITINGICEGWRFNNTGDRLKILDVSQWGDRFRLGNSNGYFYGCANLRITATDVLDLSGTTNLSSMFRACTTLSTVSSMSSWDVSAVTNMSIMFFGATLFNQDIGAWDVTAATNMSFMFASTSTFNQDITNWVLVGDVKLDSMFRDATAFNQDISSWDVSDVTNINRMFYSATSFDQDLGSWQVGNVTTAVEMFFGITLSTANYDALLVGWESLSPSLQNGVTFHGGNSQYTAASAAATARANLISNHSWSITDGGPV